MGEKVNEEPVGAPGQGAQGQPTEGRLINDFLNTPAALTFPVCTALITGFWEMLQAFGNWATAPWVGVISALVISVGLYLIDIFHTQPQQPRTRNDYIMRGVFAFFNWIALSGSIQLVKPVADEVVKQAAGS